MLSANGCNGKLSSPFLADALEYRSALGWAIIPICTDGPPAFHKKAAVPWKCYQRDGPDLSTLPLLFDRPRLIGLAVILGRASGGLACRDYDVAEAYYRWASAHPDLAKTLPTARTGREGGGFHVYHLGIELLAPDLGDGEYRGSSKCYTALPPTVHPETGTVYEWLIPPDSAIPRVDPVAAGLLPAEELAKAQAKGWGATQDTDRCSQGEGGTATQDKRVLSTHPPNKRLVWHLHSAGVH
jgi:hypothetical protein